jgi:hypothetical protein
MLHAGALSVDFNIDPSAGPFDVAAVGEAGGAVISIDPTLSCTNAAGLVSRTVQRVDQYRDTGSGTRGFLGLHRAALGLLHLQRGAVFPFCRKRRTAVPT